LTGSVIDLTGATIVTNRTAAACGAWNAGKLRAFHRADKLPAFHRARTLPGFQSVC
jgi:hypothetical protein